MSKNIVVLCSHNGGKYICEQLNTIVNQTVIPNVLYIFDFNSSDTTRQKIQDFKKEYTGDIEIILKFLNFANGARDSFFYALKNIKDEITNEDNIFFSDQDDLWDREKIESQLLLVNRNKDDSPILVFHDVSVVNDELMSLNENYFSGNPYTTSELNFERLLIGNIVIGHTMMINGSLLKLITNLNQNNYLMHDWAAILIASYSKKMYFCSKKLTKYRQHESNVLGVSGKKSRFSFYSLRNYTSKLLVQSRDFIKHINDDSYYLGRKNSFTINYMIKFVKSKFLFKVIFAIHILYYGRTFKNRMLSFFILIS